MFRYTGKRTTLLNSLSFPLSRDSKQFVLYNVDTLRMTSQDGVEKSSIPLCMNITNVLNMLLFYTAGRRRKKRQLFSDMSAKKGVGGGQPAVCKR